MQQTTKNNRTLLWWKILLCGTAANNILFKFVLTRFKFKDAPKLYLAMHILKCTLFLLLCSWTKDICLLSDSTAMAVRIRGLVVYTDATIIDSVLNSYIYSTLFSPRHIIYIKFKRYVLSNKRRCRKQLYLLKKL